MKEYFPEVKKIKFSGKKSKKPLAFKYYKPEQKVGQKNMAEQLRFSVAYWHSFREEGADPFGKGTREKPWANYSNPLDQARARAEAAFEFMDKLGVKYFTFHDRDLIVEAQNLAKTNKRLDKIVDYIADLMKEKDIELLWGTANLFENSRYMNGAATSPNPAVFAYAAAQVKKALEITKKLGGKNYVFWGGREGYETLLNTDLAFEQDNMARFLKMAADYAKKIGFEGQLLIEPKAKEPTKHQYDFDVNSVFAFLEKYNLVDNFKLNIEANHAVLAGHEFQHELRLARINDLLGSVDANQGDKLLGWDTDQFPTNVYQTTLAMYEILKNGGLKPGGLNFDAKLRRPSFETKDLFYGHIAGMDSFAYGLKVAHKLLKDRVLEDFISSRYENYEKGIGKKIKEGDIDFIDLENYIINKDKISNRSGRQERLESIINQYVLEVDNL